MGEVVRLNRQKILARIWEKWDFFSSKKKWDADLGLLSGRPKPKLGPIAPSGELLVVQ